MTSVRKSDLAGSWYPGSALDCQQVIEKFERESVPCVSGERIMLGGIVPHAGWFYSGGIACNVFKCLKGDPPPDTVVIFGKHLHSGSSNYIMKEGEWETPRGVLEMDQELGEALEAEFPFRVETSSNYEADNTVEVQLPFVKHFFPNAQLLPLGVPPSPVSLNIGERLADLAEQKGRSLRVIGSTDLTHYGNNYGFTPRGVGKDAVDWVKNQNDRSVVDLMLQMNAEEVIRESLKNSNACCSGAAAATIAAVKKMGARHAHELVYQTSYDIRPDSSFVGYVGIVFSCVI